MRAHSMTSSPLGVRAFCALSLGFSLLALSRTASAADLVRGVRSKISAGDLLSAEAAVEDYRGSTGVDHEYLDAVGWLARGAEMLGRRDKAAAFVAEVRRDLPVEKKGETIPFGAAIEVEGKLRLASEGRGSAIRFLESELAAARDPALRSRISKNLNLLTLEGQKAPEIGSTDGVAGMDGVAGAAGTLPNVSGRPILMFFWAHWCGDCKAEAAKLARLVGKYGPRGLAAMAPTRLYGTGADNKDVPPPEEKAHIGKVWAESYSGLAALPVPIPIDTETIVRYGVSATPTYALVDKRGIVRLYTPTRVTEAELSRRIEALIAE